MKNKSKIIKSLFAIVLTLSCVFGLASCGKDSSETGSAEKNITVVVREQGSGTREAFDKVVTDGEHFLEEKDADGNKVYNTTDTAIQQTKTGTVLSSVASDKNAIGYISLGSLDDSVNVVSVDGVVPSEATVLDGTYKIQRPFVVMTNSNVTLNPITADFMNYLKSADTEKHATKAGCIFLEDSTKRANEGSDPIEVGKFTKQASLPKGGKIIVRGSTSMEKFINAATKAYAELYGTAPEDIFDIQLEGSSVGRKAVEDDTNGNVIGLSSASVSQDDITSFNACLDAVVVIVHKENTDITNLTLNNLYDIFSGKITKFSEIGE